MTAVPGVLRNGHPQTRLPHVSSLAFSGVEAESLMLALDLHARTVRITGRLPHIGLNDLLLLRLARVASAKALLQTSSDSRISDREPYDTIAAPFRYCD